MDKRDPPMTPLEGSDTWYESDGVEILNDSDLAMLIVRIGIASNTMQAQQLAGIHAADKARAIRINGLLSAMVASASFTAEALKLAKHNKRTLSDLLAHINVRDQVVADVDALCAGRHPASVVIDRVRNKLGFHWDSRSLRPSMLEYATNERVVWLEFAQEDGQPYHRLANEVLIHALLPTAGTLDTEDAQRHIVETMELIGTAMNTITEYFAACVYAYFSRPGSTIVRRSL